MHIADALISTPVAAVSGLAAVSLIAVAGTKLKKDTNSNLIPMMGVMGAFIFAAQMINFSIPGTGSSGHIVGGVLLASLLGPWAAFLTLVSVLVIQCLIFADGGLLALGCNILNMGACTCLIAYPLVFKPLMKYPASIWKIFGVSILACVVGLELGAVLVTAETELSGVTALPARGFLGLMTSIHLAIGIGEGLATGAVLAFIQHTRPAMLVPESAGKPVNNRLSSTGVVVAFLFAALVLGGIIAFFASSDPDGLEWSIKQLTGDTELQTAASPLATSTGAIQSRTALLPDYENALSGIIGALVTLGVAWGIGSLLISRKHKATANS